MERRGGGFIRNEGEAECLRVVEIAQRYYLDPPIQWRGPDGGSGGRIRAKRASIEARATLRFSAVEGYLIAALRDVKRFGLSARNLLSRATRL